MRSTCPEVSSVSCSAHFPSDRHAVYWGVLGDPNCFPTYWETGCAPGMFGVKIGATDGDDREVYGVLQRGLTPHARVFSAKIGGPEIRDARSCKTVQNPGDLQCRRPQRGGENVTPCFFFSRWWRNPHQNRDG